MLDGTIRNMVAADLAAHADTKLRYTVAEVATRVGVAESRVRKALEYLGRYPEYVAEFVRPGVTLYAKREA